MDPESLPNGGPAFPCDPFIASEPGHVSVAKRLAEGMTLRDYLAAKAMPAIYSDAMRDSLDRRELLMHDDWRTGLALDAYAMADAMLKARGK